MSRFTQLKIAFSAIGLILLIWGIRVDDARIRWIAIAFLVASVLMRFLPKRLRAGDYPRRPEG